MRFVLGSLFLTGASAFGAVVYSTNFASPATVAPGVFATWNNNSTHTAIKGEPYRGRFDNETVTLTLSGLTSNSGNIAFDLYIIDTWDGNCAGGIGPDVVSFNFGAGATSYTYSNNTGCQQSHPTDPSPAMTGIDGSFGSLGSFGSGFLAVYSFNLPYTAVAGTATFNFTGSGLQGITDESWGIDNVSVNAADSAVPEPSTVALLVSGLGVLAFRRRLV